MGTTEEIHFFLLHGGWAGLTAQVPQQPAQGVEECTFSPALISQK